MKSIISKKIGTIAICFIAFFMVSTESNAQFRFGVGGSFTAKPFYIGPQARLAFDVSDQFRLSGAGTYYFGSASFFALDLDARFKLVEVGSIAIEPLAGIHINNGVALNAGVHFRIERDGGDLYFEPKVILDNSAIFVLSGGIFF